MAKKKMTLEEKLEEAIVKDAPYEVPDNWINVKLNSIVKFEKGKKPKILIDDFEDKAIPYVTIKYFQTKEADQYTFETETNRLCKEDDILIVWDGARAGLIGTGVKGALGSTLCNIRFDDINKKFMYYYFLSKYDLINSNTKGTGIPHVDPSYLDTLVLSIPPLKEQQRIVDRIESLFEKLDKAKELIEEARDDFEKRKSAILEKAFRGKLTKAWRSNNLVDYNSTWTKHVFSNIAKVKSNLVQPQDFLKYPHIAPDNIEKKTGKLLAYRTIEEDNVKSAKHRFYPGQIIYSKIRPYLSKVVIVDFEGLCSADMYPIETDLDTKYLYYYMLSDTFIDFASNSGSRSVLPKINQKELGKINVPVCSINEQKEIVRILDKLLEEEAKIDELTALEEQIELIKKSILAKAFRGQLGTNSEDDESVIELLKEILNK